MRRDLHVWWGPTRLVIWTGDDGPVTLAPGTVGAEYRGRLGHPSSYGLLGVQAGHVKGDPGALFDARPSDPGGVVPPVPGDVIHLGLGEPRYFDVIRAVAAREHVCLIVTAAACGAIGSSPQVFARLATVLARIGDPELLDERRIWRAWTEGWPDSADIRRAK